jgi:predicted CoA-binding protein
MRDYISDAVGRRVWAVVGASQNPAKFGNRIYRDLKRAGYHVYGVNPNTTSVDGDPTYPTIADLPVMPDVADIVVPSWVGRRIADDAAAAGIEYFWLQPGAESDELIAYAESLGLKTIHHACAMVEKRVWR